MTPAKLLAPRGALLAALLATLTGCALPLHAPERPAEPAPPAGWQDAAVSAAAPASAPESPWWQALQDPQLDTLQAQAAATNIDVLRRAIGWQSALLQLEQARLDEQPRASLNLASSANRPLQSSAQSVVINGVSVPISQASGWSRSYSGSLGASYELDVWSRLSAATQAARAQAGGLREEWQAARWLASTKVAQAYWTIAAIDAKLPILAELVQAGDEAVRIAQLRQREGKLRPDEVTLVVDDQFQARKQLVAAQADRRQTLNALALLLGRMPSTFSLAAARLPAAEPPEPLLAAPGVVLERRPDVRQARLAVDAALAQLHVAEAARYPSLSLGLDVATSNTSWRDWFRQPLATLGLSLAVPLVDWRRLDAQRDVARNSLDDAALSLRATVQQALADVEDALLDRQRWHEDLQLVAFKRSQKERAYALARLRQDVGVDGRLTVLRGRQEVLAVEVDAVDLRLKAWLNQLDLYKALGGAV